ncbi:ORF6C domain-containing protein [Clostridium botulinum]|uniref:Phage regulatory protein, Rha family n=2 Tax=Clostridium botulinum TaxID=1491 RepID=A0A3F2ZU35_CLOB6|nr:ORF6C domain-containing protein [Clostridium botulinum]EKN40094.1 phage regulatory protein, Rha family [Clostridium botulinum CFSAN001627]ACQ53439.1 phage regulatory protein, Rha family [Clostridium botulinum Ba4 str. 657]MBY6897972.1 ORF6C domain-containing protein [Clostridium botulinum]MBY6908926.1 ORF6C domain-containing protein [Clostridium botulinum]MBY6912286.1 ORF6C domain-containing protein [Clostridium botulinum]
MKELQVLNNKNLTLESTEVSEMTGKEHKNLMRDIRNYVGILEGSNLSSHDYFIESTYINSQNKEQPCYLLTKMGCEMVANKMTGKKGVLFTAKYVKRFNQIEQNELPKISTELRAILMLDNKTIEIEEKVTNLENNIPLFNVECKELQALVRKVGIKTLGGYKTPAYNDRSLRTKVYTDIQHQLKREFGVTRYEAIKRKQLDKAKEILVSYTVPVYLKEEIFNTNNQEEWEC